MGNANFYSLLFGKSDLAIIKNRFRQTNLKVCKLPHTLISKGQSIQQTECKKSKGWEPKNEVRVRKNLFEECMRKFNEQ